MKINFGDLFLSPAFIISLIILTSLSLNLIYFDDFNYLHLFYIYGAFLFLCFYFIFSIKSNKRNNFISIEANRYILRFYYFLSLLSVVIISYIFYSRGYQAEGNILNNLRYAHVIEKQPSFSIGGFSLFPFALSLYYLTKKRFYSSISFLIISLIPSFVLVERTSLLMKLMAFCYVGLSLRVIRIKHVVFVLFVFLFLAFSAAIGTNRVSSSSTNDVNFIITYFSYGITAFYKWIDRVEVMNCYAPLLGVFGGFIDYTFGLNCVSSVSVPMTEFNVFTYLGGGYPAFGFKGVFIVMSLLGIFYAILVRKSKSHVYFLYLLSVFIYPLVMVFYNWQFDLNVYLYSSIIFLPLSYRFRF